MIMENHLRTSDSTREQEEEENDEDEDEENTKKLEEEEEEEEEDEENTKKLEEEVKEMAKKVEEYRSTFPDNLKSSLSSFLSSQRPSLSLLDDDASLPGPSSRPHSGEGSSLGNSSTELGADDGEKTPDEVQLLRDKVSSNISAIPKVLKRMNECISRLDKLVSSNESIPPAFKRKKS